MANWSKVLNLIYKGGKIVEEVKADNLPVNPVVVQPTIVTDTTWAKVKVFYDKHKAKIWATVWALAAYFGAEYVNDAVESLPAFKDVNTKVTDLQERVTNIEKLLQVNTNEE